MNVHYSSRSSEWETPQDLFDRLSKLFGPFTLDPCATMTNAKCQKFYTVKDDGLKKSWTNEVVFMNPPYGRAIGKWLEKAYRESLTGTTVVCLIPSRTDTSYWHEYVMKAEEIILLRGRVRFVGGYCSAPFPSAVVVFRPGHTGSVKLSTLRARI